MIFKFPMTRFLLSSWIVLLASCTTEDGSLDSQAPVESSGLSAELLDGGIVNLTEDPRWVFINYWAVWCTPCIEEMPELEKFRLENIENTEVYAVNFDHPSAEELAQAVETLGVRIPALIRDPQSELGYPVPYALPTTVVLKKGEVIATLIGPQTFESLNDALAELEQS